MISGVYPIIFPTILLLHRSLLYSNQMAPQLSHFSLKKNSSLKQLLPTILWMILAIFFLLLHPSSDYIPKIKNLHPDIFHALSGLDSWKAYGPNGIPVIFKNCASELAHCLVKLFRLWLSTSTYPSCWKFPHIQPVPKKIRHSNSSNYCPLAFIFCLSKAFESVLNKIMRHLSVHNLLADCHYGFWKGQSTGNFPPFRTAWWSSSFSDFSETFAVGLDISKAFHRIWH